MAVRVQTAIPALLLTILFYGCAHYKPAPQANMQYRSEAAVPDPIPWWNELKDENLSRAVEGIFLSNPDIQIMRARMDQLHFRLMSSRSDRSIQLQTTSSLDIPLEPPEKRDLSLSLKGSFEVDVWGRMEALIESSKKELLAGGFDYIDTSATLTALFCTGWYALAFKREEETLLKEEISSSRKELALAMKRYERGEVSLQSCLTLRQTLLKKENDLRRLRYDIDMLRISLALLRGKKEPDPREPEPTAAPSRIPSFSYSISSASLLQRADIQAELARLEALDSRAVALLMDQYPRLSLSLYTDLLSFPSTLESWFAVFTATLSAPIFDGRRREYDAKEALAKRDEQLYRVRKSIVEASTKILEAAEGLKFAKYSFDSIEKRLALAKRREKLLASSFRHGSSRFTDYLESRRGRLSLEQERSRALFELYAAYIEMLRQTVAMSVPKKMKKARPDIDG